MSSRHAARPDWLAVTVRTFLAGVLGTVLAIGLAFVLVEFTDDVFATMAGLGIAAVAALVLVAVSPFLAATPALARAATHVRRTVRRAK